MKTKLLFIIVSFSLFILFSFQTFSQAPNWLWAKGMGGISSDAGYSIDIDASGNVYTTGFFQGTVDFDPGPSTFNLTSAGGQDIFISKLDAAGNFVWAKAMGGIYDDVGFAIALNHTGNGDINFTGYFSYIADFNPGAGIFNLTSAGGFNGTDIFIARLDSSGNFIWAKGIGGTTAVVEEGHSIAVDVSGNVYTTGWFSGTADFDPGAGIFNLTSTSGLNVSIFISKLDNSGNFVWAKVMDGVGHGNSIALDPTGNGNVYTTGDFNGTIDLDPGSGIFNLTSVGIVDIFISKLDSSGNFVWAKSMGGNNADISGYSMAINTNGYVYATGVFSNTIDFDPGIGIFNLTSVGGWDIFIFKSDSAGNFIWAKAMGGTNSFGDVPNSIALDPAGSGDVYTTGYFYGTTDFDPGAGIFNLTAAGVSGQADIFISKLDSSGNFAWAKSIGGTDADYGYSIELDATGHVHVTGVFNSPSIILGSYTLTAAGLSDMYVARLDTAMVTGISDVRNSDTGILLFPNPATSHLTIDLGSICKKAEVTISDMTGKIIYTSTATETQKIKVDTRDFADIVYAVRIQTADLIETKKLVIQK